MLLTRFVPSSYAPHSSRLLHVNSKLGTTVRGRTLLVSCGKTCEKSSRGEWPEKLDVVEKLLSRKWIMPQPGTQISKISILNSKATERLSPELPFQNFHGWWKQMPYISGENLEASQQDENPAFYIIRDDLLHPLLGGNKLRKLDALMPELERIGATDVITCGGCQSAHTAAVAFACAERGMSAHVLLRGERPAVPTGYNLLCGMYGYVTYIPRSEYADRAGMLRKYASKIAGSSGSVTWLEESGTTSQTSVCTEAIQGLPGQKKLEGAKNVVVVKEGAGDAIALLGLIRLVEYLSRPTVLGRVDPLHIVVDTGTGTTAVGVALAIALLGLPWKVTGVMLADSIENYEKHQLRLISDFSSKYSLSSAGALHLPLAWEQRLSPRKFGKVLPGEIETCQSIARHTGILLDPIYTLAGWESAVKFLVESKGSSKVVMLHTGGTLGLFGLAQRYPTQFS